MSKKHKGLVSHKCMWCAGADRDEGCKDPTHAGFIVHKFIECAALKQEGGCNDPTHYDRPGRWEGYISYKIGNETGILKDGKQLYMNGEVCDNPK